MTIEKKEQVTIPVWLLSVILSLLLTGFTTWGIISAKSATLEEKAIRNRDDILKLESQKVDKSDFFYIKEMLQEQKNTLKNIDQKLDDHIKETK